MKHVQDVLDRKGHEAFWIDPLESVLEAARKMNEQRVGALLVQIDGYLVGIVTERDYITKVILDHTTSQNTKVSEIMTRELVTVDRQETVDTCINLMREHHIRHLPVVEEGKAVGILSLRDLFLTALEDKG